MSTSKSLPSSPDQTIRLTSNPPRWEARTREVTDHTWSLAAAMTSSLGRLVATTGVWACDRHPPLWASLGITTQVKMKVKTNDEFTRWLELATKQRWRLAREWVESKFYHTSPRPYSRLNDKATYNLSTRMIYACQTMKGKTLAALLYALSIQNLKTHLVLDENCKMWKRRTNFILTDRDKDHSKIQKKNHRFAKFGFRNKTQVIFSCCLILSKIPIQ